MTEANLRFQWLSSSYVQHKQPYQENLDALSDLPALFVWREGFCAINSSTLLANSYLPILRASRN